MMKRRSFLSLGAGLTVGFVVAGCLPVIPKRPDPSVETASGWVRYDKGEYHLILPRAEIGQNINTAMKQIACDELGVEWDQLQVENHMTTRIELVRATVGSASVMDFALPLAQACATLRDAIADGLTEGNLTVQARPVSELRAFSSQAKFVGRNPELVDGRTIVKGGELYASDIRRPGMLYGRVLRASVSPEISSTAKTWNEAAARSVSGFVKIVTDDRLMQGNSQGIGIVATTPGALDRIEEALETVWQTESDFQQTDIDEMIDIDRRLSDGALSHQLAGDDIDRKGEWDIDLRFDIPFAAHGGLEPRAAVAEFGDNGLRMWIGSQDAFYVRDVMADIFDLDKDQVAIQNMRSGGAFGGRTICTVEREAAVLALHSNRPVKVQWTRAQEFTQGFHRSASSHRVRARVKDGELAAWWHAFVSGHIIFTNAAMPPWMQNVVDFVGDKGVARGAMPPYRIAKKRIEHDQVRLPVLTGPWRGLGAGPNSTVIECVIDECAYLAGVAPLDFRLRNIEDARLAKVLRQAWLTASARELAGKSRAGRGLACGIYKEMSYAAVVADVTVSDNGVVRVDHLTCAHDCGVVINPDQVRAQCEGNLIWGLGMALSEELFIADSGIDAATYADSPIPQFPDAPDMTIDLIDSGERPTGAGETAIVAASAAILNAIRAATGKRITRLPVREEDLIS
jgi:isoquinoline 1-oxidoreductase beta subunit